MKKTYYQMLGLARDATPEVVRASHRERRKQFASHPEIVRLLDQAALVLCDPERRQRYDSELAAADISPVPQSPLLPQQSELAESSGWRPRGVHFFLLGLLAAGTYVWHGAGKDKAKPVIKARTEVAAQTAQTIQVTGPADRADENPVITLTPLPPMPASAPEATPAETARLVRPEKKPGFDPAYMAWAVYQIVGAKARGSGVMLERDKIVTNCHVIAGSYRPNSIAAINSATREVVYPEKIAILSDSEDVCMLSVPGAPDYVANWGSANQLKIGAQTYTVSFPGNQGLSWSAGKLLSRENLRGLDVLLSSNYCRPGVSGGPLFDSEGNVVGITSAGRNYRLRSGDVVQGECVSIEAETARQVMWRTLMTLAIAPIKYEGVWSGGNP